LSAERTAPTRQAPAPSIASIYAPVQGQLARVDERLRGLVKVEFSYLSGLLDHVLESKGKRVRPVITLLAASFHPNDGKKAETMAAAVELLHLATLIHDDTVDNSALRRGKATVSNLWGKDVAVVLGDYLFATSATFVCDTGNIRVIRRFAETIMELSSGELHEMVVAHDPKQTKEQYLERIYDKTASLFTTASESGALLSGAQEEMAAALKEYGYNLGMAFQIVDDILDFEGDAKEVGKPVGSDLLHGLMTLPALLYAERHPGEELLRTAVSSRDDTAAAEAALRTIAASPAVGDAYAVAEGYGQKALARLSGLPAVPARKSLEDLVAYVLTRRS
jgi:geranylgeranyl pyrophosphate synthase